MVVDMHRQPAVALPEGQYSYWPHTPHPAPANAGPTPHSNAKNSALSNVPRSSLFTLILLSWSQWSGNSTRMERVPPVVGTQDVGSWSDSANEHIQEANQGAARKPDT